MLTGRLLIMVQCPPATENDFISYIGVSNTDGSAYLNFSVAAGPDFNVFSFVNVPDVYIASITAQ